MLTIIRKVLGLEGVARPADRTAEHSDRDIAPGPPVARSGAILRQVEKSETEKALDRAVSKTD